ncbi:TetR/AcrR family transcriptional regulator [Streptomyces sp. NPDC001940]|uniref:TetR/AcrR family transcriptional regulator n=1 Tax=unclassified Streptomyces TaxID=2593676 RepID=UPI003632DC10
MFRLREFTATERGRRLAGADRREQVLKIAADEFAAHGLHGVPAEAVARKAGITHAYVFRLFATKKKLFLEAIRRAFAPMAEGL